MTDAPNNPPDALIAPVKPARWVWVIPLLAAAFSVGLFTTYAVKRGPVVTVALAHGYGLKAGDLVRARGIVVGQVEEVKLTEDLGGVTAWVRLDPSAKNLARSGSRFWVVRPNVSLAGVGGLETLAGPRYLAVVPGVGEPQKQFTAVEEPPIVEVVEPGSLEIVLTADRRGSLKPGSPLLYRQVVIGTVLSVSLSSDNTSVEARAYIRPAHAGLIRENSRFWNASGIGLEASFKGFRLDLESLQSLVEGGISVATPTKPGAKVASGHRFSMADKHEEEWLQWRPAFEPLPTGAAHGQADDRR